MESLRYGSNAIYAIGKAPTSLRRLIDQAFFDGVPRHFRIVIPFELFQDADAIGTDGFDAQCEFLGDLSDGLTGANHAKHLVFPIRKDFVRRFVGLGSEIIDQFFSKCRADVSAAPNDFTDRLDQFCRGALFGNVSRSALAPTPQGVFNFETHAYYEHR